MSKVNRDTSESPHIPEKTSARHAPKSVRNPLVLDATSEQILRNYHYEIKEKLGAGAFSDVSDFFIFIFIKLSILNIFAGVLCHQS